MSLVTCERGRIHCEGTEHAEFPAGEQQHLKELLPFDRELSNKEFELIFYVSSGLLLHFLVTHFLFYFTKISDLDRLETETNQQKAVLRALQVVDVFSTNGYFLRLYCVSLQGCDHLGDRCGVLSGNHD